MKPVIIENTIAKLKSIINCSTGKEDASELIADTIKDAELLLTENDDNRENNLFLYGALGLALVFATILMYTLLATWPLSFVVISVGGLLYYRVSERSYMTENLIKKSLISPTSPLPKIDYLIGEIDLRINRKQLLKSYLSIVLSSVVMMAHHLFVDSSVTLNLFLFLGAILLSYFFWRHFYEEDIQVLDDLRSELADSKSSLILSGNYAL